MKIYIQNYDPANIFKKFKLIDEFYYSTKKSIEIISEDGIFYINDKNIYKINVVLDDLVKLKINNFDILLDKSICNNNIVHHFPFDYIESCITTFYYSINPKSKIKLVVEGHYDVVDNVVINKYYNFIPSNFYFEAPNEQTKFELLNNDDLNVFLSLLN